MSQNDITESEMMRNIRCMRGESQRRWHYSIATIMALIGADCINTSNVRRVGVVRCNELATLEI